MNINAVDYLKLKLRRLAEEYALVLKYNTLMRYSFTAKGVVRPDDKAALEELKERFNYAHTSQISLQFADKLLLEFEAAIEENERLGLENEKLKEMLSKPKRFLGVF